MMTDVRYAFRQLIKSPSFSATAIFALALGIGATTAMFAVIYAFLLRPLPYAEPEKLVMLQSRSTRTGSDLGVNYLDFVDWQKQSRSFSDLAFFNLRWNGNLEPGSGATETLKTTFTTANLFTSPRGAARSWAATSPPLMTKKARRKSCLSASDFGRDHSAAIPPSSAAMCASTVRRARSSA